MAPESTIGHAALARIDKLLAEKPHKVGHDFSEATRCLTEFRDSLIAQNRQVASDRNRERLEKVNAVISVVVGGHFPLGEIPWSHIKKARSQLSEVVND